jgi:hypothetical protein
MTAPNPIAAPPVISGAPPRDWIQRNFRWFVPVLVIAVCLILLTFVVGSVWLFEKIIKSTDVYKMTMAQVEASPAVISALGTPIQAGFFFGGNDIHESYQDGQSSGTADLVIPIHGPKGRGRVDASARLLSGQWQFDDLYVRVKATGKEIDVLSTNQMPASAN